MNLTTSATLGYRTRPMPRRRAERFCTMIARNGQYTSPRVERAKTKAEAYFVAYEPASETRRERLHRAAQEARTLRALAAVSSGEFAYTRDPRGWVDCHSGLSQETYEVTAESCTCEDSRALAAQGIRCKHREGLRLAESLGAVAEPVTIPAPAARRSSLNRDDPFGYSPNA